MLYTGRNKISIIVKEGNEKQKDALLVAKSVTYYKPNNSISANRRVLPPFGLWVFNYSKPDSGKKPGWLYRNMSKSPVLVSEVNPELRSKKLESDLFNIGYFNSHAWSEIDTSSKNPKKAKVSYFVEVFPPYTFRKIILPEPRDRIDSLITGNITKIKEQEGHQFNLPLIKDEINNITNIIREKGFYYFQPEYITFTADTTVGHWQMDLYISKSRNVPDEAYRIFYIGNLFLSLSEDLSVRRDSTSQKLKTPLENITFSSLNHYVKPRILWDAIRIKKGQPYAGIQHQNTLKSLNNYGIFKYADIRFTPHADTASNLLDVDIELTTMKNVRFEAEANLVTKSTGFTGPALQGSVSNGNIFHGANKLEIKLSGGYEWQINNQYTTELGWNSYNIGLSGGLTMPRFVLPAAWIRTTRFNQPKTSVNAGVDYMNKVLYYRMYSVNANLNYAWRRSPRLSHSFSPLYLNSVKLLKTTPEFDEIINTNPSIKKSFEEQFIAGMRYDIALDIISRNKMNHLYLYSGVATSGNLISISQKLVSGSTEENREFMGNIYSQFIKFTEDIRYNREKFNHSFVFRVYAGIGMPYGNSDVLPYVEQFYSGGANSIRAFVARTVGPGSYRQNDTVQFIDQTGDIRLEGNVEFRFSLTQKLKAALFLDAGNVWLLNEDPLRPGAAFDFDSFTGQLAIGTGFGLRVDLSFLILRGDFGLPLRYPYKKNDSHWVPDIKSMLSGFLFHFAIGYPF